MTAMVLNLMLMGWFKYGNQHKLGILALYLKIINQTQRVNKNREHNRIRLIIHNQCRDETIISKEVIILGRHHTPTGLRLK